MKGRFFPLLLALNLFSIALAHGSYSCLTDQETTAIIARWTSIAIKINDTIVNETVTDNFQFFSDSQDFLEGLPYGSANGVPSIANKTDLIQQQTAAQAPAVVKSRSDGASMQNMEAAYQGRKLAFSSSDGKIDGIEPDSVSSTDKIGDLVEYSGIDILVLASDSNLIQTAYSEWNNGELLYDLGTRTCFQKGNASACT